MTKMEEAKVMKEEGEEEVVLLISRYPRASTKKWIEENENEVLAWEFGEEDKKIQLSDELEIVPI
jgi:hypothetical protein